MLKPTIWTHRYSSNPNDEAQHLRVLELQRMEP